MLKLYHRESLQNCFVVALMSVLLIIDLFPSSSDDRAAHFGSGIAFITSPNLTTENVGVDPIGLFPFELSAKGNFVASVERIVRFDPVSPGYQITSIHLWDTSQIDPQGDRTRPLPTYTVSLSFLNPEYANVLGGREDLTFSPNEQYLALQTQSDVALFTVPELVPHKAIPATKGNSFRRLSWSFDSSLVAALLPTEIVVWDFQNDRVYRHEIAGSHHNIMPFGNDWLILLSKDLDDALYDFILCTRLLEQCVPYETPEMISQWDPAVDTGGQVILVLRRLAEEEALVIGSWSRQEDSSLVLTDIPFKSSDALFRPTRFSPSGRYIAGYHFATARNGLWEFETLEQIQSMIGDDSPVWLGSDEFFVVDGNKLYQTGVDGLLDQLDLFHIRLSEDLEPYYEANSTQAARNWVLKEVGALYALLIPVIYNQTLD